MRRLLSRAALTRCLDRVDVNYKWHRETLLVVAALLAKERSPAQEDADQDDRVEQPPDALTWVKIGTSPPEDGDDADEEMVTMEEVRRRRAAGEGEVTCTGEGEVAGDETVGEETNELTSEALVSALVEAAKATNPTAATTAAVDLTATSTIRLTQAEWGACGISELRSNHYIKAGGAYFRPAKPLAQQLVDFASLTLMSQVGNALVHSACLDDATLAELEGTDERSGFSRLWSKGLRPRIDDNDEFWAQEISWDTLKPGGDGNHGSCDNDLRHTVSGTLIDFLDAFEIVQRNWLPHRFHTVQAKVAERELDQNLTPQKLRKNSDWAENGEIIVKEQMQSEYWHTKYFSLFIVITGFLITAEWVDRQSALRAKAEVTVQPEWAVPSEGEPPLTYMKASFYGTVETGSTSVGEDVEYTIVRNDGSREKVLRRRLRHRVWHRVAFLGVTNEKQHVGLTTQAFHSEELEFWRCWHESGRDAALAYAAADRAAVPPLVPAPAADSAKVRFEATRSARKAAAAAAAPPTAAPNPAIPAAAAAASTRTIASSKPALAADLAKLDAERFKALVGHSDNATHLKSSGNLHYWSNKRDELALIDFIEKIMVEYGCPGKGKGPWDGLGAAVKTRVRNAIINEIARKKKTTPSGQITNALEVAQHLRSIFSTPEWLNDHAHMTIHEYVVLYIDKDEIVWPDGEPPTYSTFDGISKRYSFLMRPGSGR
eukprot:7384167-Prymnesium_polylepis.2